MESNLPNSTDSDNALSKVILSIYIQWTYRAYCIFIKKNYHSTIKAVFSDLIWMYIIIYFFLFFEQHKLSKVMSPHARRNDIFAHFFEIHRNKRDGLNSDDIFICLWMDSIILKITKKICGNMFEIKPCDIWLVESFNFFLYNPHILWCRIWDAHFM